VDALASPDERIVEVARCGRVMSEYQLIRSIGANSAGRGSRIGRRAHQLESPMLGSA